MGLAGKYLPRVLTCGSNWIQSRVAPTRRESPGRSGMRAEARSRDCSPPVREKGGPATDDLLVLHAQ